MSETLAPAPPSTYGELSPPYGQPVPQAEVSAFGLSPNRTEQLPPFSPELQDRQEQAAHDLGETALSSILEGSSTLTGSEHTASSTEQLPQTESAVQATHALDKLEGRPLNPEELYPKEMVVGDGEHIEGQQLGFIKTETGTQLTFKLTASAYDRLASGQDVPPSSGTRRIGYMAEDRYSGTDREIMTTTADVFHVHGLEVVVARRESNWRE